MISLRRYLLSNQNNGVESEYRRIIGLFLQGIAVHAVEGEREDYDRFRASIDLFEKSVSPDTPLPELLVAVGGALQAMEDYNRRTSKFVRRQSVEMQNMVGMLTQTVISIGANSDNSVNRLQDIEKSIERTRQVEDIQALKLRLGECLDSVREETLRQKADGQTVLENLKEELENSRARMSSIEVQKELDAATGLPNKKEAERAIRNALVAPEGKVLVVAVVSRVQAVNARFGYAAGDRMLQAFAEHFKKGLSADDQVYRWHGPALLAVLERGELIDHVRAEIRRIGDAKLEKTIEVGQRTVLIPIAASWSVIQVSPPLNDLLKKLEAFTAAQVPRDYA